MAPARLALSQMAPAKPAAPALSRQIVLHVWWARIQRQLADPWLVAALLIAVGAFALREVGAGIGLPNHYHWDEPTIVNRAIRMGGGDLNPHFFYYPALSMYVTFVTEACLYLIGHLLHVYPSVNAYAAAYFTNSTPFYLLGRTLGALVGAATVVLCYVVGRRFFSPMVGVLAALLLAFAPVHVANAHFITNDVPMAFFVLLSYVWLWGVYAHGRRRDYVLAGIAIGLGIATKYLPAVLLISLALAHSFRVYRESGRWRPRRGELAQLGIGVGAAVLAFFLASPYSILDWRAALHDYATQAQLSSAGGASGVPVNFVPYLTHTLGWSVGWPVYLAALVGLIAILWTHGERRLQLILLASFPVVYFLMIGSARQPWGRWLVALAPFLALSAAAVAWWGVRQMPALWRRLAPRTRVRSAVLVYGALAAVVLVLAMPAAMTSARYDAYLIHQDPRTQAAAWFDAHVSSGTPIAVQPLLDRYFLTAPIMTVSQLATLEKDIPASKPAVLQMVDGYYRARPLYADAPFVYDLAALRTAGVRYVVLSSASYHNSGDVTAEDRFYAALAQQGHVVARFAPAVDLPDADLYPVAMPTITIYALPASTQ